MRNGLRRDITLLPATQELTVSTSSLLDAKEQVRQAIDIVELVSSHIQLRRQGRIYMGICPWHDDSRPSLQVNPERQSFKCWVCDIGGDIFSFMMKIEGVEFREALQMLADRAGISLAPPRPRTHGGVDGTSDGGEPPIPISDQPKRTLYRAMAWAETQYHKCLLDSPEAEPARRYLDQRGITAESIEKFQLGFSPNQRDWILRQVKGDASREKILETIGLVARPADGGSLYDRFRGRLLFSIRDTQGRPVGLGGRVLPESGSTSPAKYINSPETPLFSKSNLLYGLDVARDAMRKSRTALVMEGYTDVIVAHQYGFGDAVAVLGTALGDGHIKILKRFADRIVLVLDGDEAGQRRAGEVLELFVAQQVDLQIATLPEGTDPCDFLHEHGAEAFAELLADKAVDALDHAFQSATEGLDFENDVNGVDRAIEKLLSVIARAPRLSAGTDAQQRNREWKLLSNLAFRFRIPEETMRLRLRELRRRVARRPGTRPEDAPPDESQAVQFDKIDPIQRELLELLIGHPECLPAVRADLQPQRMAPGTARQIFEACFRLSESGVTPTFGRLMLEFDQPAIKSLLVELDEGGRAKGQPDADPKALVQELIRTLKQQEANKQRPRQIVALREEGLEENQKTELLEKIIQQERSRQGISNPTDGQGYPDPGDRPFGQGGQP
jgi:DNA primase